MRPALVIVGAGLVAVLVYLLLPEGLMALLGFELLLIVVAWMAIRRIVPSDRPPETTGVPFVPFWRRNRWEAGPMLPLSLRRVERLIRYSERHPHAARHRLLPMLRSLAADRLITNHGVDMFENPDAAAQLLGADAWRVLGPEAPVPPEDAKRGISHEAVDAAISAIEEI